MTKINIQGKNYKLPIYLPDATLGVIRSLGLEDLKKVEGVVVNTYHLLKNPGMEVLGKFGGIKGFMNYKGLVVSDSGGWQIFSLIYRHKRSGKITDEGVYFQENGQKKKLFTPEESIKIQFEIGSDIIVCLDDFTNPKADKKELKNSVERTILWAQKSKIEFEKQITKRQMKQHDRPKLMAVIQGHSDKKLRKYCAEKLLEIGFDGYGYGGYPMDKKGNFDYGISEYTAQLIPDNYFKFALGIGTPWQIVTLFTQGWEIFDCTLPTRDARHKRLYSLKRARNSLTSLCDPESYELINIGSSKYKKDKNPISKSCNCTTCKKYTKAYLHHLFKINETTAYRLASIHNVHTYNTVINSLRQ
ncbi:queuine tRNA-ribosyltransferase family protein [Patescibacteria group bacterium]|nr:queuine tRNA-ribosyltransferase family protein [Patescibacteria group bacterium]